MSNLDWHSAALDDDSPIDQGYRNTQNVRRYFKSRLGEEFKMTRPFMAWMRANTGQTLSTACRVWRSMKDQT
ncbi:MAG: DUF6434 domain-containing protein [Pseudomonadota bacterium]